MSTSLDPEVKFPPPPAAWRVILRKIFTHTGGSQTSLSAAGCAFFSTLSLFPAITALISLYGLAFDLQTVEPQLELLRNLLPGTAYGLIVERIHTLVSQPHSSLTAGLVFSVVLALWSASASSKSIISALNLVYHIKENRGFFHFQILAYLTTFMMIIGACLTLALMVAAPVLVELAPLYLNKMSMHIGYVPGWLPMLVEHGTSLLVEWAGPLLMLLFVFIGVSLLYRFAPARQWTAWRWILPGAIVATILWVAGSLGFSWYVSHFASYGATYGPLGAVAAVMMWLYVSAYVVLFGGVINAEIEERGRRKILRKEHGLSDEAVDHYVER